MEEFNRDNLKLAALQNSTSASFVSTVAPQASLVEIKDYDEGIKMLREDKIDAMVADMPICQLSVMRYPDAGFVTLERPMTIEPFGIAISKDDPQFLNLVQNYLDGFGKLGIMTKLQQRWFEDSSWIAALP